MENDWENVRQAVEQARGKLEIASSEEQFTEIGQLCRETLITLARVVYDPDLLPSEVEKTAIDNDPGPCLERSIQFEFQGSRSQKIREFAKDALKLAQDLQAHGTKSFLDAAFCLETTGSVVRILGLVTDRTDLAALKAPYRKIQFLMPELLSEMGQDIKNKPKTREFFLVSKHWIIDYHNCFAYAFEDHEDLQNKVDVLESLGFVVDVTPGEVKKYWITDELASFLLSSIPQS